MFYDALNVGQCLRRFISLNLGYWHTWKHLVGKIWKTFADEVFAPLHFALNPSSHFRLSSSTPLSQTVILVAIKEAYFHGPDLELRAHIDADDFKARPLADQTLLLDLYFLFECAIVVVHTSNNDFECLSGQVSVLVYKDFRKETSTIGRKQFGVVGLLVVTTIPRQRSCGFDT